LMPYTSTSGVTVSLTGRSGNAKTGAMYAGLSIFGHPKDRDQILKTITLEQNMLKYQMVQEFKVLGLEP